MSTVNISDLFDKLRCPVTKKIFYHPAVSKTDGTVREYSVIIKTTEYTNIVEVHPLKCFIAELFDNYPAFKKEQHHHYDIIEYMPITDETIIKELVHGRYKILEKITKIELNKIPEKIIIQMVQFAPFCAFKNFIDIVDDINKKIVLNNYNSGWTILHWACRYGSEQKIIYLLDKPNVDITIKNDEGTVPFGYACEYASSNVIIKFIEKNVNINIMQHDIYGNYIILSLLRKHNLKACLMTIGKLDPMADIQVSQLKEYFDINKIIFDENERKLVLNAIDTYGLKKNQLIL